MSGYEKSKFISLPTGIEDELMCGICLNIMNTPLTTPCCRHSFCRQCILNSLTMASNPNSCPNCRQKLRSNELLLASRIVTNILDKQEVYCDYRSNGCPQTVLLCQLSKHLIECQFDPNKSPEKCQQMLQNITKSMDKFKSNINKREFESLTKQLRDCQLEMKIMASRTDPKTITIYPNTDAFKTQSIESAKNNVNNPETIECSDEVTREEKKKVIKICKQAIRLGTDYKQIGKHLVDSLKDDDYEWSAFVYPKDSASHQMNGFVNKIELTFGELTILLVSHELDVMDDYYSDAGDDYFGEFDDDEDDEHWEDNWRSDES